MTFNANTKNFTFYPIPEENVIRISHSNYVLLNTLKINEHSDYTNITWSEHTSVQLVKNFASVNYNLYEILALNFNKVDVTFQRKDFTETAALRIVYTLMLLEYFTDKNFLSNLQNEKYLIRCVKVAALGNLDRAFSLEIYTKSQMLLKKSNFINKFKQSSIASFYTYITPNQILVIE